MPRKAKKLHSQLILSDHGLQYSRVRTMSDEQQQPSTCTSPAGGQPCPDRGLARCMTTPSRLLFLHDEDVWWQIRGLRCWRMQQRGCVSFRPAAWEKKRSSFDVDYIEKYQTFKTFKAQTNKKHLQIHAKCISVFQKQKRNCLTHLTWWESVSAARLDSRPMLLRVKGHGFTLWLVIH